MNRSLSPRGLKQITSPSPVRTTEKETDFRQCMGCQGCCAREYTVLGEFKCKVDMFDKGQPATIPPLKIRHQLSGVFNRQELMTWRCEFRYSALEMEYMEFGEWRKANVKKEVGEKLMEMIEKYEETQ